ncbi:hypothetical protein BaRGS_00021811 [Batillaria attramentaria]|uniref:Telomeric repeat-binding factor 2-interacting protein 1 n=1 Tax=Batillaria attramentaria TaxID=370345 RepID=A0ABD0KIX8_9CAEN
MAASTTLRERSNSREVKNGLFVKKDGTPLVFHLPPGATRKKLAPLIQRGGGVITSKRQENGICLADEKMGRAAVRAKGHFWPSYVLDCVKQNTILNLEEYRCSRGMKLMRRLSGSDEEVDDGMAPAKTVITIPVAEAKKGRAKYSKAEDMNILRYLVEEEQYSQAGGKAVWRKMESLKITSHSAESMRTHFLRFMVLNLDSYNIPDSWKSRLTGNTAMAVKHVPSDGNSDQETEGEEDGGPSARSSPQLQRHLDKKSHSVISDGDPDEDIDDDFDRQLLQMAGAADPGVPARGNQQEVSVMEISDTPREDRSLHPAQTARKSPRMSRREGKGKQGREAAENASGNDKVVAQPRELTNDKEHGMATSAAGSDASDSDHSVVPPHMRKRHTVIRDSDNGDSSGSNQRPKRSTSNGKGDNSEEGFFLEKLGLGSRQQNSGKDQHAPSSPAEDKQGAVTSKYFTRGTLAAASKRRSEPDREQGSPHKKPQGKGSPAKVPENADSSGVRSKSGKASPVKNARQKGPANKTDSPNRAKQGKHFPPMVSQRGQSSGHGHSGKGPLLRCMVDVIRRKETQVARESSPSVTDEDYVTAEEGDFGSQTTRDRAKPRGTSSPLVMDEDGETTLTQSVSGTEGSGVARLDAMKRFVMSDSDDEDTSTASGGHAQRDGPGTLHTIEMLRREFGFTDTEARECLWRNSGDVVATRFWILTGQSLPGLWTWTREQDSVLQNCEPGHQDWQYLENTRGLQAVLDRQKFLRGDA